MTKTYFGLRFKAGIETLNKICLASLSCHEGCLAL